MQIDAGGGKRLRVIVPKAKPPPVQKVRKTIAPVTDVQSSGPGYGIRKATQYNKRNVTRLETVRSIQPGVPPRQVAVVYHPLAHPAPDLIGQAARFVVKGLYRQYGTHEGTGGSRGGGAASIVAAPGSTIASRAIIDTGSEAVKHPGLTGRGFANMVTGTVGGLGQVALPAIQGHPKESLRAAGRLVSSIPKDYAYRYGPLVAGNEKLYKQRLHQTTAAPGLVDIGLAAAGGEAVARPAVRGVLKATPKGKAFLEAPRPKLRTSGGEATSQALARSPVKVAVQRVQDKARKVAQEKLPSRQPNPEGRVPALQPQKTAVTKSVERHNRQVVRRGGPPVPVPKRPDEVVPLFTRNKSIGSGRAQRIAVSRTSARTYLANKREQATELNQGVNKAVAGLSRPQRHAVFHVTQGLLPIHGTLEQVKQTLVDHERQIVGEHVPQVKMLLAKPVRSVAETKTLDHLVARFKGAGAPILRGGGELATLRYLKAHADEVFGPKHIGALQAFHAGEVARGKRIAAADTAVRDATKEARRVRPQGERLGIPYEPPKPTVENVTARDAYNTAYAQTVRKVAQAKGLPEPAYFKHEKRPLARVSNRTSANVSRAVAGPKQSEMALLREGRAQTSPAAYSRGLADTIKRKHQWAGVANAVEQHAFDWSRGKDGAGLSPEQLLTEMDKRQLRPEDVSFINTARFRKTVEGLGAKPIREKQFGEALNRDVVSGPVAKSLVEGGDQLAKTKGFFAVPRHAADELLANTRPAGKALRIVGKVQGLTSTAILGLNPSWEMMQVAANSLQSGVGMHGNFPDWVRGQNWYRALPKDQKQAVDLATGIGVYEGHASSAHLGFHQGRIATAAEALGQIPIVRTGKGTVRVTDLDPTKVMFRVDSANNNFFRRAVLYNALKRQAWTDLKKNVGAAQAAMAQVSDLLRLKPGQTVANQLENVLKDPGKVERAARYVDDVLGDYLRYTARERRNLKNFVLFYGFMRYATKTLFYTLPVHHPLAAAITLKIGQLHDDEIRRIFGTSDVPPWVYSRVFQYDKNNRVVRIPLKDAQGNVVKVNGQPMMVPRSIDLARINPIVGPLIDVANQGTQASFGVTSPLVQAAFNVWIAKKNIQQNRPLTAGSSAEQAKGLSLTDQLRIFANQGLVSPTLPGRLLMPKGAQADTALPGLPSPIKHKTPLAQEKAAAREAAQTGIKQQLAPLFVYKPDTTAVTVAQRHGPVPALDKQIQQADAKAKTLRTSGKAVDEYGYATKEYADLQAHIGRMRDQRTKLLARPKTTVKIKRRPQTAADKVDARLQRQLDRLKNPGAGTQAKLDRQLERLKIAGGG